MKDESLLTRLNKYITKIENSCWIWSGTYSDKAPITTINQKSRIVRKVLYEIYKNKPSTDYLIAICKNHKCVNPDHIMNRDELLEAKINKNPNNGCWEWIGAKKGGYGYFKVNSKDILVHRLIYEKYKGKILPKLNVCHTCDNPSCCNPDHLWLGTQMQNIHDCINKKRNTTMKGEKNPYSKITEKQAIEIKQKYKSGIKPTVICRLLNLPYSTVYKVCTGESWKYLII